MAETSPALTLNVDAGQSADLQESAELTRRLRHFMLDSDRDVFLDRHKTSPA